MVSLGVPVTLACSVTPFRGAGPLLGVAVRDTARDGGGGPKTLKSCAHVQQKREFPPAASPHHQCPTTLVYENSVATAFVAGVTERFSCGGSLCVVTPTCQPPRRGFPSFRNVKSFLNCHAALSICSRIVAPPVALVQLGTL